MKYILSLLFLTLGFSTLSSNNIPQLAKDLQLYPGTKATVQWERIFSSPRRMQKYKLDLLPEDQRAKLELYLLKYAADSEQPIVPGL